MAGKIVRCFRYFSTTKIKRRKRTVFLKLKPDVDLEVILPSFPTPFRVKWILPATNVAVRSGEILCFLFDKYEHKLSVLSPSSGYIRAKYLTQEETITESSVLCLIQINKWDIDRNPHIVSFTGNLLGGQVEWHRGVGMMVEKGEHVCTVRWPNIEEQSKPLLSQNIFSPIRGIIRELYVKEKDTLNGLFRKLFMVKHMSIRSQIDKDSFVGAESDFLLATSQFSRITSHQELPERVSFLPKHTTSIFNADMGLAVKYSTSVAEKRGCPVGLALLALFVRSLTYGLRFHDVFYNRVEGQEVVEIPNIDISVGLLQGMNMVFPTLKNIGSATYKDILDLLIEINTKLGNNDYAGMEFDANCPLVSIAPVDDGHCLPYPGIRLSPTVTLSASSLSQAVFIKKKEFRVRPMSQIALTFDLRLSPDVHEGTFFAEKIRMAISDPPLTIV